MEFISSDLLTISLIDATNFPVDFFIDALCHIEIILTRFCHSVGEARRRLRSDSEESPRSYLLAQTLRERYTAFRSG